MRSRLEADYAAHLDRHGYEWEYEPIVFAGPAGQWLPDFRYRCRGESESPTWYIEVKPLSHLADCRPGENYWGRLARIDELLSRMAMTWLTEPDALVILDWWDYGGNAPVAQVFGRQSQPWLCEGNIPFRGGMARHGPGAELAAWKRNCAGIRGGVVSGRVAYAVVALAALAVIAAGVAWLALDIARTATP